MVIMNRKQWIKETRAWLERERNLAFHSAQSALSSTSAISKNGIGSVSVQLMLLSGYSTTEGVLALLTGDTRGWDTLKSASHLWHAQVRLLEIAEGLDVFRTKYIPLTPNELILGSLVGLVADNQKSAVRALRKLRDLQKSERFPADAEVLFALGASLSAIVEKSQLTNEDQRDSGLYSRALAALMQRRDIVPMLPDLADFHREQMNETDESIGLFAWPPFDFFPIEVLACIIVSEHPKTPREFRDELLQPEYFLPPPQIRDDSSLSPVIEHVRKLIGHF
jgi:hypothetical protein